MNSLTMESLIAAMPHFPYALGGRIGEETRILVRDRYVERDFQGQRESEPLRRRLITTGPLLSRG